MKQPIPVIDVFAGAGGLGEGFSSLNDSETFKVVLSIEMDEVAHKTLELRAFFRQFDTAPDDYYRYLRGQIKRDELFDSFPSQSLSAQKECWKAELGEVSRDQVNQRITERLSGQTMWVLVGGPPCQAYSVVGRSRRSSDENYLPEQDKRNFLYQEFLNILVDNRPPIFVMENVEGVLSSEVAGNKIFSSILSDLENLEKEQPTSSSPIGYNVYPIGDESSHPHVKSNSPKRFVVNAADYGIP